MDLVQIKSIAIIFVGKDHGEYKWNNFDFKTVVYKLIKTNVQSEEKN